MKKNLIFILCFLVFVFLAFVAFFPPKKKKMLIDESFQHYVQKNYLAAELSLSELEQNRSIPPLYSYKAFIYLAKKDFENADQLFQKALNQTYDEFEKGKLFLGKALSCYHQKKFDEMAKILEIARKVDNSKELTFLDALYFYEKEDFQKAATLFLENAQKKNSDHHWLEHIVQKDFPETILDVYFAHSLICLGKFSEARSLLEKNIVNEPLSNLFLGYSYLKECQALPFSEKKSFLNVALCYFQRSSPLIVNERKKIALDIAEEVKSLLKSDEESVFAFSFIHLLEKWNLEGSLETIANQILEKISLEGTLKSIAFCNTIKDEFKEGAFHDIFLRKLFSHLEKNLKEKNRKNPFECWECIETFANAYPQDALDKVVTTTQNEILKSLHEEKGSYNKTIKFLKFWKKVTDANVDTKDFAYALLNQGMTFWRTENQEQKGTQILKIAILIADNDLKKQFHKEISDFFKALYRQAYAVNMVARLSLIYDAAAEFKIAFKGFFTKSELANQLADAAYFFKIENYLSARDHAEWIVKVDPENKLALKLSGLSALFLGNYSKAMSYLTKIDVPDQETREALLLCEAKTKEDEKKTPLAQVDLLH